jgi:hypothetical protein
MTAVQSLDELPMVRNGEAIARRLRWLDERLRWHGVFRRADLAARFAISPQQASADIGTYLALAPTNAVFDSARKEYGRSAAFAPIFPRDALRWMAEAAEEGDRAVIPLARLDIPPRAALPDTLALITEAYAKRRALAILYQSLTTSRPTKRVICPHHIVDTGERLHARAWDARSGEFRDFLVARIRAAALDIDHAWVGEDADTEWQQIVDVDLAPHDSLSPSQRDVVALDFGMKSGRTIIRVRRALLLYALDRLGLLDAVRAGHGRPRAARGTMCLNAGELSCILPSAA